MVKIDGSATCFAKWFNIATLLMLCAMVVNSFMFGLILMHKYLEFATIMIQYKKA